MKVQQTLAPATLSSHPVNAGQLHAGKGMLSQLSNWLAGRPAQALSAQEGRATLAVFLIIAFCFNALPPNFTFSGTTEASADGSLINQFFWFGMLLLALSAVINTARSASGLYVKAMPLLALCLLLVASSLWSLAPAISLRRAILECIVVGSILVNVASLQRAEQAFIILYRVAAITLVFELVMLLRANGFDETGLFRGIHTQKNVLGLVGAVAVLCGVWVRKSGGLRSLHWNTAYLVGWLALLVLSRSKTSLALILVAPAIALGLQKFARSLKGGVGVPLLGFLALAYSVFAVAFISGVDVGSGIEHWVHRLGFTGRDDIWQFLTARFLEHPWLGHGYGGFWDIGPAAPNVRYGTGFIPMINQAHNGYLDLLLALGLTGLVAYLCVFAGFLFCLSSAERKAQQGSLALCWTLVVFSLLHNFTETTLLRGYSLVWVVQLIAMAITYRLAHEARRSA